MGSGERLDTMEGLNDLYDDEEEDNDDVNDFRLRDDDDDDEDEDGEIRDNVNSDGEK